MTLKKKLIWGLGFLFFIIFALAIYCSYYIGKLSREAENILKDNYNSIVYAKSMVSALEEMKTAIAGGIFNPEGSQKMNDYYQHLFETGRAEFEKNLRAENGNITEIQEREYVDKLDADFPVYLKICLRIKSAAGTPTIYFQEFLPAFEKLRQAVGSISDLNMQAVVRKSQATKSDADKKVTYMTISGFLSILLALAYFWYFPFYTSKSLSYLSERMKSLLKENGIAPVVETEDEMHILLQAINLLENKFKADKGSSASS